MKLIEIALIVLAALLVLNYWQTIAQFFSTIPIYQLPPTNQTFNTVSGTEKMRWNHFPVKVFIEKDYVNQVDTSYIGDFRAAMNNWQTSTTVSFQEINSSTDADVIARWVPSLRQGSLDALGDTQETYVDSGEFFVERSAVIELLTSFNGRKFSDTDMENIAEHELGHSVGLWELPSVAHSTNPNDIMYRSINLPTTSVIPISTEDIQKLSVAYSSPALPDLRFSSINASQSAVKFFGRIQYYFNLSFEIQNSGLVNSNATKYRIILDNKTFLEDNLQPLEFASAWILGYTNLRTDTNFTSITMEIDPYNTVAELSESNNIAVLNLY